MNADTFRSGMRWEEYFASMQTNRELLGRKSAGFALPEEAQAFWQDAPVAHILVFTEDWCQDSVSALPPLLAVAEASGANLRIMRRGENVALQRALTGEAFPPVPLFILYDLEWNELGRFVEMPREFRHLKDDPEEAGWLREMYDEIWWQTELEELAGMVE